MIVILGSGNDSKICGIGVLQWSGLKQRLRRYETLNPVDPGSDTNASGTTNTSNTKHIPLGQQICAVPKGEPFQARARPHPALLSHINATSSKTPLRV